MKMITSTDNSQEFATVYELVTKGVQWYYENKARNKIDYSYEKGTEENELF